MLTFEKWSGINNVLPANRLSKSALAVATNVDVGLDGELRRRGGYAEIDPGCHKNLHQADGFMLATCDGVLTSIFPDGNRVPLFSPFGPARVWYCNLPDGRTTYSNGLIQGVTDGLVASGWGVPIPDSVGEAEDVSGGLYPGDYLYQISYVRMADGLEGGAAFSGTFHVERGGLWIRGIPTLDGHAVAVYLSSQGGDGAYYAGSTVTDDFSYTGKTVELSIPAPTDLLYPCPSGATICATYGPRVWVAVGSALFASRPHQFERFDIARDFKQFTADITLIVPVDDGVYVGTTAELAFLSGAEFDKLQYRQVLPYGVVMGSGVPVAGEFIRLGDQLGHGSAMLCIAGGVIVAGFNSGNVVRLTGEQYSTSVTEVVATFRVTEDGIPQYIAIPQ